MSSLYRCIWFMRNKDDCMNCKHTNVVYSTQICLGIVPMEKKIHSNQLSKNRYLFYF